ncbi:TPA: hypothetical protein ACH3X1_013016 [Trebouxia sp. C0004]
MGEQANASYVYAAAATRIQSCPHISLHLLRHHCADMLISIQFCTTVFKKTHADLWTALKAYGCLEEPKPDVIRSASLGCVHKVNTDSQNQAGLTTHRSCGQSVQLGSISEKLDGDKSGISVLTHTDEAETPTKEAAGQCVGGSGAYGCTLEPDPKLSEVKGCSG